ncbi:MAG: DUF1080 domain-containing protein [Rubripirellula sp.]|nr:DUF1080 domain-containing protein [Rubripirellula sp.]
MNRLAPITFLVLWLPISFVSAQNLVITDPDKGGTDFAIQGEYSGDLGKGEDKEKFGIQVIAQGKNKFLVVGYHGGLPGDGWNGEEPVRVEGEFALNADGTLSLKDTHGTGTIKDGVLICDLGEDGEIDGRLKRVVRKSPTTGKKPPKGAVVLYGGSQDIEKWKGGKADEESLLIQGVTSKDTFGSHHLHVEFRLPFMPEARGQGRGNSGCYVQGRYEVQMLDSFGLEGKMNECGGVYSVSGVETNMCFPPLSWQTYDIDYTAAEYDGKKLIANPRMTVRHNGVIIHDDLELPGERNTTAAPLKAGPEPGPVFFQNHGNPVRYRNVWVLEKD